MTSLKLGTRGSQLALWQAHAVKAAIEKTVSRAVEVVVIKTSGDRLAEAPLADVGGKRLFVKEIEDALLRGEIDLAVHSAKDLPAILPDGLTIGSVLAREDPLDVLVLPLDVARSLPPPREAPASARATAGSPKLGEGESAGREGVTLTELVERVGQNARVGTSSVRRIAQLSRLMPRSRFEPIRGNLDTRLRKLDRGDYDMLVLAAAGLRRLGFADRISLTLPIEVCVPAPGQGAIAIEIRSDDVGVRDAVALFGDDWTAAAIRAERALVEALGGGCQIPIGAVALPADDGLELHAVVVSLDGGRAVRAHERGSRTAPAALGECVAGRLAADGAMDILAQVHREQGAVEGLQP